MRGESCNGSRVERRRAVCLQRWSREQGTRRGAVGGGHRSGGDGARGGRRTPVATHDDSWPRTARSRRSGPHAAAPAACRVLSVAGGAAAVVVARARAAAARAGAAGAGAPTGASPALVLVVVIARQRPAGAVAGVPARVMAHSSAATAAAGARAPPSASARELLPPTRDGVLLRVVAFTADDLGQDSAAGIDEPIAYLEHREIRLLGQHRFLRVAGVRVVAVLVQPALQDLHRVLGEVASALANRAAPASAPRRRPHASAAAAALAVGAAPLAVLGAAAGREAVARAFWLSHEDGNGARATKTKIEPILLSYVTRNTDFNTQCVHLN